MNYFLTYDNAVPLFVGGHSHGKKRSVPLDGCRYWTVALPMEFGSRCAYERELSPDDFRMSRSTEVYRVQWIVADNRRFRILVHEVLTPSAALMLMMSTVGEHPDLVQRVKELEAENKALKRLLQMAKF